MKMKPLVAAVVASLSLAGCASQPDKIAAQQVSPLIYKDYSCEQIVTEMQRASRRLSELQAQLKKLADDDQAQMAVGMILFWPALFFLEGGDGPQAMEYSRLRGEHEALQSTAVQKNCTVPADAQPARWFSAAHTTARDVCPEARDLKLVSTDQNVETFNVACPTGSAILVRCESGACRTMQ